MKLLKRDRREPWCEEGVENAGELGVCVGISTDAHRCEVFTGLRNEDDGLGDVGALDGAGEMAQIEKESEIETKTYIQSLR